MKPSEICAAIGTAGAVAATGSALGAITNLLPPSAMALAAIFALICAGAFTIGIALERK